MKLGLAQIKSCSGYEEYMEQSIDFMYLAGKLGLNLVCFPEMHLSDFFLHKMASSYPFQQAEGIPGPTVERFQRLARELNIAVILNYTEIFIHDFYSASPVIDSTGKILGVSRMVHIPQIEGYYAQSYFMPGCGDFHVYKTQYCRVGVLISFDRHYPEAARALAIHDADVILIPGSLYAGDDLDVYEAEIRTIAYQNCVYVGMCNRVGVEDGVRHIGGSILAGPDGKIIVRGSDKNELVIAEIDVDYVREKRKRSPYLTLRRPDEYLHIIKYG